MISIMYVSVVVYCAAILFLRYRSVVRENKRINKAIDLAEKKLNESDVIKSESK